MKNWYIYVLKHPRTNEVRYVGWAKDPVARLRKHIKDSIYRHKTHKECWVLSLVSIGLLPVLEVIEEGSGPAWKEAERRWIAHYRAQGTKLVNQTDGGDGTPGCRTSEEWSEMAKKRQAAKTPEQRSNEAKKAIATKGPDVVRAAARKGAYALNAIRTSESRSAASKKWHSTQTPEERSAIVKKANANRTPEQRKAISVLVNQKRWAKIAALKADPPSQTRP